MLSEKEQDGLEKRLNRVEGQLKGIKKMIFEKRYCIDILMQIRAATAALGKVEEIILENHLNTCVLEGLREKKREQQQEMIDEILVVLKHMRR